MANERRYYDPRAALSLMVPLVNAESVDVSSSDWEDPNSFYPRAITVNTSGDVKLDTLDTTGITVYLQAGVIYAIQVSKIYQTGTTAAGIVVWK